MDIKFLLLIVIVVGAVVFVPIVPNGDISIEDCPQSNTIDYSTSDDGCKNNSAYISIYTKYFSNK